MKKEIKGLILEKRLFKIFYKVVEFYVPTNLCKMSVIMRNKYEKSSIMTFSGIVDVFRRFLWVFWHQGNT